MKVTPVSSRLASITLALLIGSNAFAQDDTPSLPTRGLEPLAATDWDYAKARHLAARAGFGATPDEVAKLHAMGLRRAVEFLVNIAARPQPDFPLNVQPPPAKSKSGRKKKRLNMKAIEKLPPEERKKLLAELKKQQKAGRSTERAQYGQLREWWVRRMIESPRPLEEKLTLFWHGHFATGYKTVKNTRMMYLQNQLLRQHALGNFGKLLHGIARDAAMLRYLDNDKNVRKHPNENLAREIMELFSMGEGNYTEQDIKEGARALTGNSFDRRTGKFEFRRRVHDDGKKTIFGRTGKFDGTGFVDLILEQPATASFIARKIFAFFAHPDPSEQTTRRLSTVLRDNGYELAPLLRTLFSSKEFYGTAAMGTQIKSPVQLLVGTIRGLGLPNTNLRGVITAAAGMDQELMQPPNVKGWDGGATWINAGAMFARQNATAALLGGASKSRGRKPRGNKKRRNKKRTNRGRNKKPTGTDLVALLAGQQLETPAEVVDYLTTVYLVVPLSAEKRRALINALNGDEDPMPPSSEWNARRHQVNTRLLAALILMMSLPEYQLT